MSLRCLLIVFVVLLVFFLGNYPNREQDLLYHLPCQTSGLGVSTTLDLTHYYGVPQTYEISYGMALSTCHVGMGMGSIRDSGIHLIDLWEMR